jgi:hypothetical protein
MRSWGGAVLKLVNRKGDDLVEKMMKPLLVETEMIVGYPVGSWLETPEKEGPNSSCPSKVCRGRQLQPSAHRHKVQEIPSLCQPS